MLDYSGLTPMLDDMRKANNDCGQEKLRTLLIKLVLEFEPQCEISDVLYKSDQLSRNN